MGLVAARLAARRQGERIDRAGSPARLSQPQAAGKAPRADAMPRLCLQNLLAVLFVQCVNPTLFSEPSRPLSKPVQGPSSFSVGNHLFPAHAGRPYANTAHVARLPCSHAPDLTVRRTHKPCLVFPMSAPLHHDTCVLSAYGTRLMWLRRARVSAWTCLHDSRENCRRIAYTHTRKSSSPWWSTAETRRPWSIGATSRPAIAAQRKGNTRDPVRHLSERRFGPAGRGHALRRAGRQRQPRGHARQLSTHPGGPGPPGCAG